LFYFYVFFKNPLIYQLYHLTCGALFLKNQILCFSNSQ